MRRWPTENFVTLAKRLLDVFPKALIVITGAPAEQSEAEKVAARIGASEQCVSLAGHTTLRQLLTLYCLSDLLITNDSGPSHFASLTPIRGISLFGPETPLLYAPLGGRTRAISAGLACSPCVNMLNHRFTPCNDNRCMQSIGVENVFSHAMELLNSKEAPDA
jgi:ADP-heptose:LPS heptosyltransferase